MRSIWPGRISAFKKKSWKTLDIQEFCSPTVHIGLLKAWTNHPGAREMIVPTSAVEDAIERDLIHLTQPGSS